jgi:phosphoheptose isomerase
MACGTPVVGSNVGGIKFTVRDSETGYLVPPHDADALGERLAHLYKHPKLLTLFSRQAIQRVNDLFTWKKVTTAVAALYEEILATSQPAAQKDPDLLTAVDKGFDGVVEALQESRRRLRAPILEAAKVISACFESGGKILICGHGDSAADADYLAASFVGRFGSVERPGLPALSLNAGLPYLGALSTDAGSEYAFARQVETFGRSEDVFLGISAQGCSRALRHAFQTANRRGLRCVAMLGTEAPDIRRLTDVVLLVPPSSPQSVEEVQLVLIHLLCGLVEQELSSERTAEVPSRVRTIWAVPRGRPVSPRRPRSTSGREVGP